MIRTVLATVAIVMLLAWLGPALDDHSADYATAADLEAAQQQASAQARYDAAVQRLCGPNAAWMERADGAIQCTDKHGRRTRQVNLTVQVAQPAQVVARGARP